MLTAGPNSVKASVPVLFLITGLSMGGAQRALLHLLGGLNRDRFTPTVACLYNGDGAAAGAIQALDILVFDARMRGKGRPGGTQPALPTRSFLTTHNPAYQPLPR